MEEATSIPIILLHPRMKTVREEGKKVFFYERKQGRNEEGNWEAIMREGDSTI